MALDFDTLNNELYALLVDTQSRAAGGEDTSKVFADGVALILDTYIAGAVITFPLHRNAGSAHTATQDELVLVFSADELSLYVDAMIKAFNDSQTKGEDGGDSLPDLAEQMTTHTDVFVKTITVNLLNVTAGAGNRFGGFKNRPLPDFSRDLLEGISESLEVGIDGGDARDYFVNLLAESLKVFLVNSDILLNAQVRTGGITIIGTIS